MSQVPPPPQRSDSLPDSRSVPPIPPKPSLSAESQDQLESPTSGNLKKMATLDQLHIESSNISQNYESKTHFISGFNTFHEFYKNEQLCDVEIQVGKKSFRCHKIVLASISNYFRSMFTSEMAESREKVITIHDLDETAVENLIEFAYTAKIQFSVETVQQILYAASILQMEVVAKACCDFMKKHLHPTNCIGVHKFAEQHNRVELIKMADEYILENFLEVINTDEFKSIPFELLESLVASPDLNVENEIQVYEAVMKWIKHDSAERKKSLCKLMSKIKLSLLTPTYLVLKVAPDSLVRQDIECRDFLDEAKAYQMSLASLVHDIKISDRTRPRKSYAGVLFCVGGRGAAGDPFKSIECYDPRKNRWFQVAEMNTRRRHVGVCCSGGLLYAVGGHDGGRHLKSGEIFDPVSNSWKCIKPMSTPRRGIALACIGGAIYAVGGLDDSTCYNTVERYDPSSEQWSFVAPMNLPRGGVGVTCVRGCLYAAGGNDGVASLNKCEKYDPLLNKWTSIPSMNRHRAGAGVAELDGFLYVVGGFDDSSPLNSCERYNTETNTWTEIANMSCCRGGVGVATMAGQIFAVGGHDGTNYLCSVEAYDPLSDSWNSMNNISQCRAGAGLTYCQCSPTLFQQLEPSDITQMQCY